MKNIDHSIESFEDLIKRSYDFNQHVFNTDKKWRIMQELYNKNFIINDNNRDYGNLPKKIHQIWLGGDLPEKYKKYTVTWRKFNPDWEYKLWTDEDIGSINILNIDLFNSIKNNGQKSDFLRYHILNQFGGLYVDTDFECLKSFNSLSYLDFFIGIAFPSNVELFIGLIASIPNNPIMIHIIKNMNKILDKNWRDIFETTGTYFFTRNFFDIVDENTKNVVTFPPDYFYPFTNEKGYQNRVGKDYIKDFSYALHYWGVSWL